MRIKTRKFGDIDIQENKIINIPSGIPGFPGRTKYTLLEKEETRPFCWLQCVEDPDLAIIIMSPFEFKPDYTIDLDAVIKIMSWDKKDKNDLLIFVVININDEEKKGNSKITANLIGPIVINSSKNEAVQMVIYDTPYSHQHNIFS